ncbi:XapX domain-containing protein [Tunturiibacter gelidoferens]|jgi:XapX domain-containing protein|uniref:XapX domain-containing protein n=1 Tax=Tunturiibacter gelidiferens TaxID=3069689 RepID=A0A9X0QA84_9BACT|nr:XapX domain-containing protein [Edaphobacter lichenicola]
MRILIAFIVAFAIGAASRWTGVPSLAPQAIIGALLIVAMSTGYVSADRLLKHNSSPSVATSASTCATAELATYSEKVLPHERPTGPEPEADTTFWRQKSKLCNSSLPICYSRMSSYALKALIAPRRRRLSDFTSDLKDKFGSWREKHTYPLTRNHDMKQHDWPLLLGFLLVGSLCLL